MRSAEELDFSVFNNIIISLGQRLQEIQFLGEISLVWDAESPSMLLSPWAFL